MKIFPPTTSPRLLLGEDFGGARQVCGGTPTPTESPTEFPASIPSPPTSGQSENDIAGAAGGVGALVLISLGAVVFSRRRQKSRILKNLKKEQPESQYLHSFPGGRSAEGRRLDARKVEFVGHRLAVPGHGSVRRWRSSRVLPIVSRVSGGYYWRQSLLGSGNRLHVAGVLGHPIPS